MKPKDPYRNLRDVRCKCNVCGKAFTYWLCEDSDWLASGYTWQAVCKPCFEKKVPHPHYTSFEEYDDQQLKFTGEKAERWDGVIDRKKRNLIEKFGPEGARRLFHILNDLIIPYEPGFASLTSKI